MRQIEIQSNQDNQLVLQEVLHAFQVQYVLFDRHKQLVSMVLYDYLSEFNTDHPRLLMLTDEIIQSSKDKSLTVYVLDHEVILKGKAIIHSGELIGVLILFETLDRELEEYRNMEIDLKVIFDSSYDVIFVADGQGNTLRVSSACERLWGIPKKTFIEKNAYELEKEGIFRPSVTRMVLEQKRKISVIQKTITGRTLLVYGTPVFNEEGHITRVINASRDITEISQLQTELNQLKKISEEYEQEINRLKIKEKNSDKKLIYRSKAMERVVEQVTKIAQFNSTVLISGESGVGKEIIASLIHDYSSKANKPFIKINCGAIPEMLFESELFGYEKGTFTGANQQGKKGLLEAADKGTLFLDEVTEMPLSLQVKLLRFLQESEIHKLGSISPIKVDTRVIAATNKNIKNLVDHGNFREDLFYRLNVIPLEIPSLKERKEDIPVLIDFFTKEFNNQNGIEKMFDYEAINLLIQYEWKGNVRELKNFIERVLVVQPSHDNIVKADDIRSLLGYPTQMDKEFHFEIFKDIDLMDTLSKVEKNILDFSARKYNTTVEIAKALNVNQSTISKKLKKYGIYLKQMVKSSHSKPFSRK